MVSFTVKQGLDVVSQDSKTTIFTWRCWLNFHKSNLIYSVKNLHYSTTPIPSNKLSNILFSLIYIQVLYVFLVSSFSLNYTNPQNLLSPQFCGLGKGTNHSVAEHHLNIYNLNLSTISLSHYSAEETSPKLQPPELL